VILGRWTLHFHMMGDASRGSVIEGCVAENSGAHSFVIHGSHGVTLRDVVAYNTWDSAIWWDPDEKKSDGFVLNQTDDLTLDHVLVAKVQSDPSSRGYRLAGIELGLGNGNKITDSHAVGVLGNKEAAGINWPDVGDYRFAVKGAFSGPWEVVDVVAHNNAIHGFFVWENRQSHDDVTRPVSFLNGELAWRHGAYTNAYQFIDATFFRNGTGGVGLLASSHPAAGRSITFVRGTIDGGIYPAVRVLDHRAAWPIPRTVFDRTTFIVAQDGIAPIGGSELGSLAPGKLGFLGCGVVVGTRASRALTSLDVGVAQILGSDIVVEQSDGTCTRYSPQTTATFTVSAGN
jgi:hypothetical protein